jgi:hypothetical protein
MMIVQVVTGWLADSEEREAPAPDQEILNR